MEHSGLLSWANNIRLTMASDPGRQVFKDQVRTHGFMFLEDYLDNIVSGGKADPLIELVKTPGRKKAIARKPKLMSSKLANNIFLEENVVNENQAPGNSLQAALEVVQHQKVTLEGHKRNPHHSDRHTPDKNTRPPFSAIQPLVNTSDTLSTVQIVSVSSMAPQEALEQTNVERNDLSVIAEDDEPSERSRLNISARVRPMETLTVKSPEQATEPISSTRLSSLTSKQEPPQHDMEIISTSSMNSLHSVPLNSPLQRSGPVEDPVPMQEESDEPVSRPSGDAAPESLPTSLAAEVHDYLMADPQEAEEIVKASEKPTAPSFPTLPEPMPLRKSMRHPRDPSLNAVMMGSATPGAAVGGKRTSWLMKAREIKALEGPPKKSLVSPVTLNHGTASSLAQGIKRKSGDTVPITPTVAEDGPRLSKVPKIHEGETASRTLKDAQQDNILADPTQKSSTSQEIDQHDTSAQQGVLDRLKKTVEGLGVRVSKTMSKSVGGGTATALAEARAAAEARVAERDRKDEEMTIAMGIPTVPEMDAAPVHRNKDVEGRQNEGRLSISDLFPTESRMKEKHKVPEKLFHFTPSFVPTSAKKNKDTSSARERTSTTPNHSPPQTKNQTLPLAPFFNKPPVFVPPAPGTKTAPASATFSSVFSAPSSSKYTMPPSMALRFSPLVGSPSSPAGVQKTALLSAQSTLESVQSNLFDRDDASTWIPSTQDTEFTSTYQSQPRETQICDEDDSWPIDEKLAAGVQWTYGASKEDSMTWSTLPSQSQRADTGPIAKENEQAQAAADVDLKSREDANENLERNDLELEDIIMESSKTTVSLVEPKIPRSQSQMSMASSESSQSQAGFLGQASKLLSSALGTTKKKQPEVKKVLQMAASAAKKQQEEADKKAARLKEMENRRQLALQRKAEEEKAKALDEERKLKEETERRKKERDDLTDKRTIKASTSKREEEVVKKGKAEPDRKQEIKKPLVGKSHLKGVLKQPSTSNLNSSLAFGSSAQPTGAAPTPAAAESSSSLQKGKGAAQQSQLDDDVSQPSQLVQSQMAARAKAQIDASKQTEPRVASESIELPDINSEYSDSDDEDRPRTFDPPEWAQSPELRQALEMQSTINPDDIFGAVRPLKMEEIFKTKTSRFRPRSSSANWTGTDRLTVQEEKDYAVRMGFK